MEPSAFSRLYVVFLVFLGLVRAVVRRLAWLLWVGIVFAALGTLYLYASAAVHLKKFLIRPGPFRRFNRTL